MRVSAPTLAEAKCCVPSAGEAHRLMINVSETHPRPRGACTWVNSPASLINGRCDRAVTVRASFCNEEASAGTRGQTGNWNHLFPPLSTDGHKLEPDHFLSVAHPASRRAISLVLFFFSSFFFFEVGGVGKLGWAVGRERRGQLRESGGGGFQLA